MAGAAVLFTATSARAVVASNGSEDAIVCQKLSFRRLLPFQELKRRAPNHIDKHGQLRSGMGHFATLCMWEEHVCSTPNFRHPAVRRVQLRHRLRRRDIELYSRSWCGQATVEPPSGCLSSDRSASLSFGAVNAFRTLMRPGQC